MKINPYNIKFHLHFISRDLKRLQRQQIFFTGPGLQSLQFQNGADIWTICLK